MPNIVRPGRTPLPGQSATGFKPNPWNVQRRYIAPEWEWAWRGLEHAWMFWEGGGAPFDLVSSADFAVDGGNPIWTQFSLGPTMEFDGELDHLRTTLPDDIGNTFTAEIIGTSAVDTQGDSFAIFLKNGRQGGSNEAKFVIQDDGNGNLRVQINSPDGGATNAGSYNYAAGELLHIIATYDQSTLKFWVNGNLNDSTAATHDLNSTTLLEAGGGENDLGGDAALWDGKIGFASLLSTALPDAAVRRRSRDPFGPFRPAQQVIVSVPSGADVTLTADSGTYSVTGSNADLLRDLLITGESGSYSVTGLDADLLRSLLMSGDAGTYSVTGSDADLFRALQMTADAGSYSVTGQTADLLRALLLDAESGTYTVTGSAADLIVSGAITMTADAGSYSISGADADLLRDLQFTAESGSYTVTGQPADLLRALLIAAEAGGYNVTGQDADVLLDRILSADAGTYSLSGQDADLVLSAAFKALNIAVSVDQPLDLSASVDQPLDMDADVDQPLDMDVDVEPQE